MPCYKWLRYNNKGIYSDANTSHQRINFKGRGRQSLCLGGTNLTQEFVH